MYIIEYRFEYPKPWKRKSCCADYRGRYLPWWSYRRLHWPLANYPLVRFGSLLDDLLWISNRFFDNIDRWIIARNVCHNRDYRRWLNLVLDQNKDKSLNHHEQKAFEDKHHPHTTISKYILSLSILRWTCALLWSFYPLIPIRYNPNWIEHRALYRYDHYKYRIEKKRKDRLKIYSNVRRHNPLVRFQIFTEWSWLPLAQISSRT